MLSAERIALLKHGAPPRNALEAALRNAWYGGGASYEKTVGPAPIISISDSKPKAAKSLIVGMEPIQAGSGAPSPDNIRPISGRTEANIYRYAEYDADAHPTYTIQLGQTVYGGTVDVVSGLLTVDRAKHIVSSGQGWAKSSSYPGGFYRTRMLSGGTAKEFTPFMCSHAESVANLSQYIKGTCYCDGSINIRIMDSDATYEDWNTYCVNQYNSGTPIEICYELATPQTYQLTPTQIQLLKGSNTLWSDGDSLTLTYIGTQPANLLGGMLGGGLGGGYTPPSEEPEAEPVNEEPAEEPTEGDGE